MKTLFAAAVAVTLLTGTVTAAYADNDRDHGRHFDRGHRDHDGDKRRHRDYDRRDFRGHDRRDDHRYERDHHRNFDHRDHDRHYDRRDAYRAGYWNGRSDQRRFDRGRYIPPRGYYVRHWRHGDYLPRAYYGNSYIVRDYHAYHLGPPPHGHHWVRVNDDVVLAAVASGLVVSVVNGIFY